VPERSGLIREDGTVIMGWAASCLCTVAKTVQISETKGREVLWMGNFPEILGYDSSFPRINGKFPLEKASSLILSEICQILSRYCAEVIIP
jgi:hypothetical protein